ncbi:hypothetical protein [Streptomyces sp. NPDC091371]|uniref:hypothetical protein n=1 Tax=Streptomyces sp. NPDC091371 TaxID=3155303 RepID=UPI0034367336
MMQQRGVRAAAMAAVLVLAVTGASCDDGGSSTGGRQPKRSADASPTGGGKSVKPTPSPKKPSSVPSPTSSPTPRPDDKNTGHIRVDRTRPVMDYKTGVIRASCTALDIELTLSADHAAARWEAVALDYDPGQARYADGNIPRGVVIEPASGTVALGKTQTVRVRGSFEGRVPRFWIIVQYPDFPQSVYGGNVRHHLPVGCLQ